MHIVKNTPEILHVVHNPWIMRWGAWIAAIVIVFATLLSPADNITLMQRIIGGAAGLAGFFVGQHFFPQNTALLKRTDQTLTLTEDGLTNKPIKTHSLTDIDKVISTEGGGKYAGLQSLRFIIQGVDTPMEKGYSAQDRKKVCAEINDWLTQA